MLNKNKKLPIFLHEHYSFEKYVQAQYKTNTKVH